MTDLVDSLLHTIIFLNVAASNTKTVYMYTLTNFILLSLTLNAWLYGPSKLSYSTTITLVRKGLACYCIVFP